RLLRSETAVELVGEATNGPEALTLIRRQKPHIAVLDIRLPGMDAFGVLRSLNGDYQPVVIFVTAFGEHAVDAFQAGAADYLLKPFEPQRLKEALRRARHQCASRLWSLPSSLAAESVVSTRISLRSRGKIVLVELDEIEHIVAANSRCRVVTTGGSLLAGESLGTVAGRLPAGRFVRVSRFAVVNLAAVTSVKTKSHGDQVLELRSGTKLTVARTCRAEVMARLGGTS
ncbi:MAG TPA: LytTR family DNA-binding domain-containing protein, partial [Verrucomicrobiota bacterium]|nr:LytTR family DNA-binding domain-containing protein [Verrucomicrobiota bacterium]